MNDWNPRFVAYAAATGMDPQERFDADVAAFPGGAMAGFMGWLSGQWREFYSPGVVPGHITDADHAAFDAWLTAGHRCQEGQ